MREHVVTLNAGSSSIKFALFRAEGDEPQLIASGNAEGLGVDPGATGSLRVRDADGAECRRALGASDHDTATRAIVAWIDDSFPAVAIRAVGHRIVHGGLRHAAPAIIDDALLAELATLIPLAPLHQPHNLAGVAAARAEFPTAPQIACFDTAFHRGHSFVNEAYALPRSYYTRGLRRFGFHGLSYEFIAGRLREVDPARACGRVIVAHLGNGASLCAMKEGRSVASSMGFSALDGIPMGTRCGQIDPGLLLYLMQHDGMSAQEITHLLYHDCGLLGLSGLSSDMRILEASPSEEAREAIDYFTHRIRMEIASLTATIGGLDALVFTGGIGENSVKVRAKIVRGLDWLGLHLDEDANSSGAECISEYRSSAAVYKVATDEETMIARHALKLTRATP